MANVHISREAHMALAYQRATSGRTTAQEVF